MLKGTRAGAIGEIQITDAMRALLKKRDFYAVRFEGTRYDAGDKLGFLMATVVGTVTASKLAEKLVDTRVGSTVTPLAVLLPVIDPVTPTNAAGFTLPVAT